MTATATVSPDLSDDAKAMISKLEAAWGASDKVKKEKSLRITILSKNLKVLWFTQVDGTPGMMAKVAVSKARSYFAGKSMDDPSGMNLMCCYFCPWMCGCTNHMPVQGVIPFELAGTDAACLVVCGAPQGSTDLSIANEVTNAANGGAPDSAAIER